MNFYIGNSIKENNCLNENVEIDDMLLDYVYKISRNVNYDVSVLYNINPYGDTMISQEDVAKLMNVCKYILNAALLEDYDDKRNGIQMLTNLIKIAQSAIDRGMGLITIGD